MQLQSRTILAAMSLSIGLLSGTGANAALVGVLGGQAINDSDLNVTWLADANYANTSGYAVNGLMTWTQAQSWITSLNAENGGVGHLGYHDWRLPATLQPDASCGIQYNPVGPYGTQSWGLNCTGSDMGHLFYNELGGVAGSSITATHNANYSLFSNLQSSIYWSGTEYAPNTTLAYNFSFNSGNQDLIGNKTYSFYALAVRPGQVAAVPVPAAAWLFGSGLLGLVGVARRRLALR
jgi:hypothetical protein